MTDQKSKNNSKGAPAKGPRFTAKRLRRSIKMDRVHPRDFVNYQMIYACEQCSHFSAPDESCTLGFPTKDHRKEQQLKSFHTNSHMAFCRFLEID